MQPVFYVVEAFPRVSETFVSGKALWLLDQGVPLTVVDKYPWQRQYGPFSTADQQRLAACTLALYPGQTPLARMANRGLAVMKAWAYGLPRYPMALRRFQQLSARYAKSSHSRVRGMTFMEAQKAKAHQNIDRFLNFYYAMALRPQAVHVHHGFNALDWVPVKQVLGDKLRLVVSFLGRDVTVDPAENPAMYHELFAVADVCLASSPYLRDLAIYYGCPPEKIHVHPVEINTDFFYFRSGKPFVLSPDRVLRIVSVGRLVWEKDYETALEAIARLRHLLPQCRLQYTVFGDGPLRDDLGKCAKQLQLEGVVHFAGDANPYQIRDHLWEADLFLITSISEGLGAAALEAQSCGLPVVATRTGGLPYAVCDGETGFIADPGDAQALAHHMKTLAENPDLCRRMGEAGHRHISTHFSARMLYPRLLSYYGMSVPQVSAIR